IQTRVTEACFYTQDSLPLLWSGFRMLNLGEPAGPSAHLACGYALMAAVAGIIPIHAMAEAERRRAIQLVEQVGQPVDVAFVLKRVSSYRLWRAEWAVAEQGFRREIDIAERVGDQRLLGDAKSCLVFATTYQGRFAEAEEILADAMEFARRRGDEVLV